MISQLDQSKLKALWRGDAHNILQRIAQDMVESWHRELPTGDTEFQYLKSSLERDGKIMGVDQFLKKLEEIANKV